jgi:hypothetical protein
MNMKIFFEKNKTSLVVALCAAMMAFGALAWSTITLIENERAAKETSGVAVLALLSAENGLAELMSSGTPQAAVHAAAGMNQVIWVVARPSGNLYPKNHSVKALIEELKQTDFNVLMGYPDKDCSRGAAVACWVYPASSNGIYPSQEVAERLVAEFKSRDIGTKLRHALSEMQIDNLNAQRFGMLYEQNHPVLAWMDYISLKIANGLRQT